MNSKIERTVEMELLFKASKKGLKGYHGEAEDFEDGEHKEVSEIQAKYLMGKFPDNFSKYEAPKVVEPEPEKEPEEAKDKRKDKGKR